MIPNGKLRKQNRPLGVMKVVSLAQLSWSGICQNQLEVSSFENIFVPANSGATSSRFGSMYLSRLTASLSLLRSTQILTFLLLFTTGTIGVHQSVGSVISSIIPSFFIFSNSSSTFDTNGKGILLAVLTQYGWAYVTLHGKTYLNDIPLKRQKKTDGERMTNGL